MPRVIIHKKSIIVSHHFLFFFDAFNYYRDLPNQFLDAIQLFFLFRYMHMLNKLMTRHHNNKAFLIRHNNTVGENDIPVDHYQLATDSLWHYITWAYFDLTAGTWVIDRNKKDTAVHFSTMPVVNNCFKQRINLLYIKD